MVNLLAKLADALVDNSAEAVPHDWKTIKAIARECGRSPKRTQELVQAGIEAGLIEVRKFRIRTGGKVYPVPHYREVVCEKPTARKR